MAILPTGSVSWPGLTASWPDPWIERICKKVVFEVFAIQRDGDKPYAIVCSMDVFRAIVAMMEPAFTYVAGGQAWFYGLPLIPEPDLPDGSIEVAIS